jgi:hypothetical protein
MAKDSVWDSFNSKDKEILITGILLGIFGNVMAAYFFEALPNAHFSLFVMSVILLAFLFYYTWVKKKNKIITGIFLTAIFISIGIIFCQSISIQIPVQSMPSPVSIDAQNVWNALVAIATIAYAILTWFLVRESKRSREAQFNPLVVVSMHPRDNWINWIDMRIENLGGSPALNIRFDVKTDFEYAQGKKLSEMSLIKKGLPYLAPKQSLQFFFTSLVENTGSKLLPFALTVKYTDIGNKSHSQDFLFDFSALTCLTQLGTPPIYEIAEGIKSIARDVGHVSTGFNRMKVVRYTKQDIDKENATFIKRVSKMKKAPKK